MLATLNFHFVLEHEVHFILAWLISGRKKE